MLRLSAWLRRSRKGVAALEYVFLLMLMTVAVSFWLKMFGRDTEKAFVTSFKAHFVKFPNS